MLDYISPSILRFPPRKRSWDLGRNYYWQICINICYHEDNFGQRLSKITCTLNGKTLSHFLTFTTKIFKPPLLSKYPQGQNDINGNLYWLNFIKLFQKLRFWNKIWKHSLLKAYRRLWWNFKEESPFTVLSLLKLYIKLHWNTLIF